MSVDLDHLIVFCSAGAPEAEDLVRLGLTEGSPNIHAGQDTTNRRFFFQNGFIELLWVSDPNEVQSEPVRGTQLCILRSPVDGAIMSVGRCWRRNGVVESGPSNPRISRADARPCGRSPLKASGYAS